MVDRVFAIWQALYPNEYVQPFRTQWGTYTIPRGSIEDVNTRKSSSSLRRCRRASVADGVVNH